MCALTARRGLHLVAAGACAGEAGGAVDEAVVHHAQPVVQRQTFSAAVVHVASVDRRMRCDLFGGGGVLQLK